MSDFDVQDLIELLGQDGADVSLIVPGAMQVTPVCMVWCHTH
jgi:hypothetical protein